jgi:site-specific DNA recombinase
LLSFAQFEREIIAERTRDKMSAARRKGKWTGGSPVLGYDVAPGGGKLVVNEDEARRVRAIFDLYLEYRSLIPTVREINRRGWTTKQWTTRNGREHRGKTLNTSEQSRIIRALVERIGYDGRTGKVAVTFRSAGFKTLCDAMENNADQQ